MQMKAKSIVVGSSLLGIAAGVGARSSLHVPRVHGGNPDGAWMITVTLVSGPPGVPLPPPFKALITMTEDGGVVEADLAPPVLAQSTTTGHGEWTKIAERKFGFTYLKLVSDGMRNSTSTMKVNETITLNLAEDQYSGAGTIDILDAHEKPIASFGMKTQATRIGVEIK